MNRPSDIPENIRQWAADFWDAHLETDQVDMVALAFMAGQGAGPSVQGLTIDQAKALEFIRTYQADHAGASPSYAEIGAAVGRSKGNTHDLITRMVGRGVIERSPNRARSITIVQMRNVSTAHRISGEA